MTKGTNNKTTTRACERKKITTQILLVEVSVLSCRNNLIKKKPFNLNSCSPHTSSCFLEYNPKKTSTPRRFSSDEQNCLNDKDQFFEKRVQPTEGCRFMTSWNIVPLHACCYSYWEIFVSDCFKCIITESFRSTKTRTKTKTSTNFFHEGSGTLFSSASSCSRNL